MSLIEGLSGIFKSKSQKSETELLLDECGEILAELRKQNLSSRDFLRESIRSLAFKMLKFPYEIWLEKCLKEGNTEALNDLIFQYAKIRLLPGCSGGYDHCERLIPAFFALACGDVKAVKNVFAKGLPPSKNGYKFLCVMSDLLTAMLWEDEKSLDTALKKACEFAASKKPLNERYAVGFMMALREKDAVLMGENLQNFCASFSRTDADEFEKRLCVFAHGLHALARLILPFEVFEQVSLPTAKNFSRFYAKRLLNAKQAQPKLYFSFPSEFRIFNEILSAPPAKTVLTQLYFPKSKAFYLDHDTMVENLADEILKAGTLNQNL